MIVKNSVLNAYTATGVTLDAGYLNVPSTVSNNWDPIEFKSISLIHPPAILPYLAESLAGFAITYTAANSTTYSFTIEQEVNGKINQWPISFTSDASGTDGEIGTAINGAIATLIASGGLKATVSGTASPVTVTTTTGYTLKVTNMTNVTAPSSVAGTQSVTSSTDATPVVVTKNAHGLVVGQRVTLSGGTLSFLALAGQTFRISAQTANTFTLEGSVGDGSGAGVGGTVTVVAQAARGSYADAIAHGASDATSGNTYAQCTYEYDRNCDAETAGNSKRQRVRQTLWYLATDADYAAFTTLLTEFNQAFNAGAVTANPNAIAAN